MTNLIHRLEGGRCHVQRSLLAAVALVCLLCAGACLAPSIGLVMRAYAADGATAAQPGGNADAGGSNGAVADSSQAAAKVAVAEDTGSAVMEGAGFGISKFSRLNKGTNKLYSGEYYGYRYSQASRQCFSVLVLDTSTALVYMNKAMLESQGIDIADKSFQDEFVQTLHAIDAAASKGGAMLSSMSGLSYVFTSETSYTRGNYSYRFDVEVEEGYYYTTSTLAGSDDGGDGALFCDTGIITPASSTVVEAAPTGIAALTRFLQTLDYSPLLVSLKTTGVAIVFIFVLGLLAGWLTIRMSDKTKGIFDTVFTIPMVLPPTVCGFLLLLLFGGSTVTGSWLIDHGINLVFTWPAAVICCIVVGFPLMYRTSRGAFEALDATMLDAARTLGWSELHIFLRLMVPLAWPSIAAGTVLAFARAMGEFGATLFFAGNYVGVTQTIPIAIYFDWMAGQTDVAIFWVIVVILISFLVILFINIYSSHTQKYRLGGSGSGKGGAGTHGAAPVDISWDGTRDDGAAADVPVVKGGVGG